jgi:hypothetical protein
MCCCALIVQVEVHGASPADNTQEGYKRHLVNSPLIKEQARLRDPSGPDAAMHAMETSPLEYLHFGLELARDELARLSSEASSFVCLVLACNQCVCLRTCTVVCVLVFVHVA